MGAGAVRRDVEAALAEALGPEAALSRSTVSRICQKIRTEFEAWRTRSLEDLHIDYLFLDASHFKMHPDAPAEPGLISAAELHFSRSLRQRCLIHRLRNALAKVSATDQDAFKAGWWAVFDGIDEGPGEAAMGRPHVGPAPSRRRGSAATHRRWPA
jgi:putative transposase